MIAVPISSKPGGDEPKTEAKAPPSTVGAFRAYSLPRRPPPAVGIAAQDVPPIQMPQGPVGRSFDDVAPNSGRSGASSARSGASSARRRGRERERRSHASLAESEASGRIMEAFTETLSTRARGASVLSTPDLIIHPSHAELAWPVTERPTDPEPVADGSEAPAASEPVRDPSPPPPLSRRLMMAANTDAAQAMAPPLFGASWSETATGAVQQVETTSRLLAPAPITVLRRVSSLPKFHITQSVSASMLPPQTQGQGLEIRVYPDDQDPAMKIEIGPTTSLHELFRALATLCKVEDPSKFILYEKHDGELRETDPGQTVLAVMRDWPPAMQASFKAGPLFTDLGWGAAVEDDSDDGDDIPDQARGPPATGEPAEEAGLPEADADFRFVFRSRRAEDGPVHAALLSPLSDGEGEDGEPASRPASVHLLPGADTKTRSQSIWSSRSGVYVVSQTVRSRAGTTTSMSSSKVVGDKDAYIAELEGQLRELETKLAGTAHTRSLLSTAMTDELSKKEAETMAATENLARASRTIEEQDSALRRQGEELKSKERALAALEMVMALAPLEGFLMRADASGTLKPRWFSVRHCYLLYYKMTETNPLACYIDLRETLAVFEAETFRSRPSPRPSCGFVIETPRKRYYLVAASKEEKHRWVDGLNKLMTYLSSKAATPSIVVPRSPSSLSSSSHTTPATPVSPLASPGMYASWRPGGPPISPLRSAVAQASSDPSPDFKKPL